MIGRPRTVSDTEILAATERTIARYGPARLTLARVAEEVGLAPATLLQRFGSKRGLLLAVAARGTDAFSEVFARARASGGSPLTVLQDALTELVIGIDSPATLANHLAFLQLDLTDPALKDHAVRQSREMRDQIRRLLDMAVAGGDLRPCDSVRLSQAVYATYCGALLTWAIDGQGTLPEWLRREIHTLLDPYRPDGVAKE